MRSLIVAAVIALGALAAYVRAADVPTTMSTPILPQDQRDIVFVLQQGCVGRWSGACATEMHFNGQWRDVKLCRAKQCVAYEEVFRVDNIQR